MSIGTISVIAVGKFHSPYWARAQADYVARLRRYTTITLIEVKDALGQGFSEKAAEAREGDSLLLAAASSRRLTALRPAGRGFDSPQFAAHLKRQLEIFGKLAFLVGGPSGLSPKVLSACHEQLSLSAMTLPHELARIVLFEQLYRAFTILGSEKYHR